MYSKDNRLFFVEHQRQVNWYQEMNRQLDRMQVKDSSYLMVLMYVIITIIVLMIIIIMTKNLITMELLKEELVYKICRLNWLVLSNEKYEWNKGSQRLGIECS